MKEDCKSFKQEVRSQTFWSKEHFNKDKDLKDNMLRSFVMNKTHTK